MLMDIINIGLDGIETVFNGKTDILGFKPDTKGVN